MTLEEICKIFDVNPADVTTAAWKDGEKIVDKGIYSHFQGIENQKAWAMKHNLKIWLEMVEEELQLHVQYDDKVEMEGCK